MKVNPLVVLDTDVLEAALRSRRGASFAILSQVGTGLFDSAISVPLRRGSRRKFDAVLRAVPDIEPDANDRLPNSGRERTRKTVQPKRK